MRLSSLLLYRNDFRATALDILHVRLIFSSSIRKVDKETFFQKTSGEEGLKFGICFWGGLAGGVTGP